MDNRMSKEELLELIKTLKIDPNEFTILSSGALVLRGILISAGDLDIAVTEKGLEQLKNNYNLIAKERGWYQVSEKVECVLNNMEGIKEKVGDYNLEDINHYFKFIKTSSREKDKARIPVVESYIKKYKK